MLELPHVWMRPLAEVAALVTRGDRLGHVEAAWQRGEGILFLTPHLGCFEITAQYLTPRMRRSPCSTVRPSRPGCSR
jgi:KDO2-lipid IV(A) lauroyltransferase